MTTSSTTRPGLRRVLHSTVALGFVAAIATTSIPGVSWLDSAAQAQSQGQGVQGGHGGRSGQSGQGQSTRPPQAGASSQGQKGGSTDKSTTEATEEDSDKKGPKFGGGENSQRPAQGTRGGRPVWAKEGIPAVELGRLSVARAPVHVIDKALAEAIKNWATMGTTVLTLTAEGQPTLTMTVAELYSLSAEKFATIVATYYESIVRIDSPLENLGLMKDVGLDGVTQLTGVTPASTIDLLAIFLGSASDKSIAISNDTVIAMATLLGLTSMTVTDVTALAEKAEAVRIAILAGHG